MNFFMPLVAFSLRSSYLGSVWFMKIFMLTWKVLFPALVGVFLCGGGGWFGCCCWVGFCFSFGFLGFFCIVFCFQDFRKLKNKFRTFYLLTFGKIFFFNYFVCWSRGECSPLLIPSTQISQHPHSLAWCCFILLDGQESMRFGWRLCFSPFPIKPDPTCQF